MKKQKNVTPNENLKISNRSRPTDSPDVGLNRQVLNMLKRYNGKMGSTHLTVGEFQQRYGYNKEEPNGNYKNKNYSIINIQSIQ